MQDVLSINAAPRFHRYSNRLAATTTMLAFTLATIGPANASDRAPALIKQLQRGQKSLFGDVSVSLTIDLCKTADGESVAELAAVLMSPGDLELQGDVIRILYSVAARQPSSFDDALPYLIGAIPELNPRDRAYAMMTFGLIGPRAAAAAPVLRLYVAGERDATVYEAAWSAAALIAIAPNDEQAIGRLLKLLSSVSTDDRIAGTGAIAVLPPRADEVVAALRLRLADTDIRVRALAASALSWVGGEPSELMPTVRDALRADARYIRTVPMTRWADRWLRLQSQRDVAMILISKIGPEAKDAVPELVSLLEVPSEERLLAMKALGAIGPDAGAAVGPLRKLAIGWWDSSGEGAAAKEALSKIAPEKPRPRRSRSRTKNVSD